MKMRCLAVLYVSAASVTASFGTAGDTQSCTSNDDPVEWFSQTPQMLCLGAEVAFGTSLDCAPTIYCIDPNENLFPTQVGFRRHIPYTDLNGDGSLERLIIPDLPLSAGCISSAVAVVNSAYVYWSSERMAFVYEQEKSCISLASAPLLHMETVEIDAGVWGTTRRPIAFDYESAVPDANEDWFIITTLLDVDRDRLMDLVCICINPGDTIENEPDVSVSAVWFRNISGNGHRNADINADGRVDGLDLSILLAYWTP